jgi:hypothetical protein
MTQDGTLPKGWNPRLRSRPERVVELILKSGPARADTRGPFIGERDFERSSHHAHP